MLHVCAYEVVWRIDRRQLEPFVQHGEQERVQCAADVLDPLPCHVPAPVDPAVRDLHALPVLVGDKPRPEHDGIEQPEHYEEQQQLALVCVGGGILSGEWGCGILRTGLRRAVLPLGAHLCACLRRSAPPSRGGPGL